MSKIIDEEIAEQKMATQPVLSIVIPCLNEEQTLPLVLAEAREAIDKFGYEAEIIVADNGSTDRSRDITEACGARVVEVPLRGYGSALTTGIEAARGDFIIIGDADCSYNFMEIDRFMDKRDQGFEFIMGTRLKGDIEYGAMPNLHRYVGTPVLTWLINIFFGGRISDCNCGIRGFTKDAFERLEVHSTGMEWASETIIKANLVRLKMAEVPVTLRVDKRDRKPHLNPWRDGWRHLRFIITYAADRILFFPGLIMSLIGWMGFAILMPGPVKFQGLYFDFHFLFPSAMCVILGAELIMLSYLIKTYTGLAKYNEGLRKFLSNFSFEHGMILGLILMVAGLAIDISIVHQWISEYGKGLFAVRPAIMALTLMCIGVEMFSACFFMSVLKIPQRRIVE